MTDADDRLLELEDRCFAAAASGDDDACRGAAVEAAGIDPDCWLILYACGCADMRAGRAADAIAQWMAAADRMEDLGDIERMSGSVAEITAECVVTWPYPAHLEMAGLMALSHGISELTGGSDGDLMLEVMEAISGRLSDDQSMNAGLLQAASEVAYTAAMFGTDLSTSVESARALIGFSDRVLESMAVHGVPDEMDRMPMDELREHIGVRVEAYRVLASEWDAASARFAPEQIAGFREYWRSREAKVTDMMESLMDAGLEYSRSRDPRDLEATRRAAKILVLRWLRVRK